MFRTPCYIATVIALLAPISVARAQTGTDAQHASTHTQTFLEFQVDQSVKVKRGAPPSYPTHLRAAGVTGEVVAQFVVDERGTAMMHTFKAVKSTNPAFTESVKRAVAAMSFEPAQVSGQKVKQLVQLPFKFAGR